jgi:hypothetical protein
MEYSPNYVHGIDVPYSAYALQVILARFATAFGSSGPVIKVQY